MRVLVVDDDRDVRQSLAAALGEAGHVVIAVSGAEEALRLLPDLPRPHVILLDLRMPVMSGWELVEIIRELPGYANLPVVAISASTLGAAGHSQFDAFLPKPFRLEELERTMDSAVAARRSRGAA